jgi:hypothetical protein
MSARPYKLTCAGTRALLNIAEGKPSTDGLNGRSEFGGHRRTMQALFDNDYLDDAGALTDKARAELNLHVEEDA